MLIVFCIVSVLIIVYFMPRPKIRRDINWKLLLLIIGLPVVGLVFLGEYVGWPQLLIGLGLFCGLLFLIKLINKSRRRAALMEKYGDKDLVKDIEQGYYWQGQTADQLKDALGEPEDIDVKVLKTKTKSVWKYNHLGGNRYGLRINLDDAVVIGWDQKD